VSLNAGCTMGKAISSLLMFGILNLPSASAAAEGIARRFGVLVIPTRLFLDRWENLLLRQDGYADAASLQNTMSQIPTSFDPVAEELNTLARNSEDFEALVAVGRFYAYAGLTDSARAHGTAGSRK